MCSSNIDEDPYKYIRKVLVPTTYDLIIPLALSIGAGGKT